MKQQSISSFEHLFLFLQTFALLYSISLCFDRWIFSHLLANLFPSYRIFIVLFRMLGMLFTVNKACHVPHVLGMTTWGTIFMERFFVSKEWVRSWSYASLLANLKMFHKNFWPSVQKKKKNGNCKAFSVSLKRNKVTSLQPTTLLNKKIRHSCFPVNLEHLFNRGYENGCFWL